MAPRMKEPSDTSRYSSEPGNVNSGSSSAALELSTALERQPTEEDYAGYRAGLSREDIHLLNKRQAIPK